MTEDHECRREDKREVLAFLAVARARGFTKAAGKLGVSRSARTRSRSCAVLRRWIAEPNEARTGEKLYRSRGVLGLHDRQQAIALGRQRIGGARDDDDGDSRTEVSQSARDAQPATTARRGVGNDKAGTGTPLISENNSRDCVDQMQSSDLLDNGPSPALQRVDDRGAARGVFDCDVRDRTWFSGGMVRHLQPRWLLHRRQAAAGAGSRLTMNVL